MTVFPTRQRTRRGVCYARTCARARAKTRNPLGRKASRRFFMPKKLTVRRTHFVLRFLYTAMNLR